VKPKKHLEGSILNLSSTGGGGRGSDAGSIIGDVINHGKKQFWGRGLDFHYHGTLEAGDNTLEASLARLLLRTIATAEDLGTVPDAFLASYVVGVLPWPL
jgi:ADP-ribosyl-[dinitrogen reductase] hydrolase